MKIKCCLMFFCFFIAGTAIFVMLNFCPDKEGSCDAPREKVGFPHEQHMALYDCLDCHHVYDDLKNNVLDATELYDGNPDIQCLSCHGQNTAIDLMTAFHRQCIGCHNRENAAGRRSAPVMCSECHRGIKAMPPEYEMIIGD